MSITILPDASHQEEDFGLSPAMLASLWKMEESHFWHQARNRWISDHLQKRGVSANGKILEVGCGSGTVAGYLASRGYNVTGVDTAEVLVRKAAERFPELRFVVGDVGALPNDLAGPYDVIAFFDVLEHLDNPLKLLNNALQFAAPNALIVATVPALKSLFSVIDQLSGHKRRYEVGELSALLTNASLIDVQEFGIFRWMLPLLKRQRHHGPIEARSLSDQVGQSLMAKNFKVPPSIANRILQSLCDLERLWLTSRSRNQQGGSIIASGRLCSSP